jgi:serine/threonine-protein kinase
MTTDSTGPVGAPAGQDDLLADCLDAVAASPAFAAELRAVLDGREQLGRLAPATPRPGEASAEVRGGAFGKYELRGVLGRGGMGVVYRAWEADTGRTFALKMIRDSRLASPADVDRFRADYRIAAHLDHANIVPICEVGEQDGQPYFTMPLVEGGSLAARLAEAPLPSREAACLLARVARAVHYAHEHGVIHRDLKPANILLDAHGEPHVIDFGLAKILGADSQQTATGQVLGTLGYMSPEQAAGQSREATATTDVYGLGAVLYAMLTGRPPFHAETVPVTLRQVIDNPPAPPQLLNPKVDTDLQTICLKCLSKKSAGRYASAAELADDLDRYLARQPVRARRPNLWDHLSALLGNVLLTARQKAGDNFEKEDLRTWSHILFGSAFAILAMHLSLFALLRAGASLPALWLTAALGEVFLVALLWGFLMRGRRPPLPSDRTSLVIWIGYGAGSLLLLPLARPPEELGSPSALLAWYPPLAILTGLLFLLEASMHWGRLYLIGLGFMALAVPLWLLPAWSPLSFGLFAAGCLIYLGIAYRRSAS